jgi:hypothetical protein
MEQCLTKVTYYIYQMHNRLRPQEDEMRQSSRGYMLSVVMKKAGNLAMIRRNQVNIWVGSLTAKASSDSESSIVTIAAILGNRLSK